MNAKTALITGACKPIGKAIAKFLAENGERIILVCSSIQEGEETYEQLVSETNSINFVLKLVDFADFRSVRELADNIIETEIRLDILIHCASAWLDSNEQTPEGYDVHIAANAMGPFLLTHLMIDMMKRSVPSRIIYVISPTYTYGNLEFDELNRYIPAKMSQYNYFNSLFANMCIANELARRLEHTNVAVNIIHPGYVVAEQFKNIPLPKSLRKKIFQTPSEAAVFVGDIVLNEDVVEDHGEYFIKSRKVPISKKATNQEKNEWSWEIFKAQTGVGCFDPRI